MIKEAGVTQDNQVRWSKVKLENLKKAVCILPVAVKEDYFASQSLYK